MVGERQTDDRVRVFISYSRKDEDFAQELLVGLQIAGFEPYLDQHDIAAGEDWEQRLGRLIEAADTVVFVISPDAVDSERCAWEVDRTIELKKRLLPIVFRRVDDALVPPRLQQLNYVFFDRPFSFAPSLQALATALRTDVGWIREHTRIGELALRWDGRGRAEALLLRGEELAAAKTWLAAQPHYAPEPSLLHHAFIRAGEDDETARVSAERRRLDDMAAAQAERRKALENAEAALKREAEAQAARARARRIIQWGGAVVALVLVVTALGFAAVQLRNAKTQAELTASAEKARADAVRQRDTTLLTQSRYLAGFSQENRRKGDIGNAVALARRALPLDLTKPDRPLALEAMQALYDAYASKDHGLRALKGHTESVLGALQLADGRLLTWSYDKTARLWAADGAPGPVLEGHTELVSGALQLADGRLLTWSHDKTARLWAADGAPGPVLNGHTNFVFGALQLADGRLLTWSGDTTARLWAADGAPGPVLNGHTNFVLGALQLADGRLLTWSEDKTARLWAADGAPGPVLESHNESVSGALQLADGRLLTWSHDKTARLWAADGAPGPVLKGHTNFVLGALQLADGRLLTWSYDGAARLWAADGAPGPVLKGHTGQVLGALQLADGRLLTWSADQTARLWASDGAPGPVLKGHTES